MIGQAAILSWQAREREGNNKDAAIEIKPLAVDVSSSKSPYMAHRTFQAPTNKNSAFLFKKKKM